MIFLVQATVIAVAITIMLYTLAGKRSHSARAWKKLVLCLLSLCMVTAVLFPNITNVIANAVGVGRGADLLLYIVTISFIGYAVNNYLQRQKDQEVMHKLARRIALDGVVTNHDSKKR